MTKELTAEDWIILRMVHVVLKNGSYNHPDLIHTLLYMRKKLGIETFAAAYKQLIEGSLTP